MGKDSDTRSDRIVPGATYALVFDFELLHLSSRNLLSFLIGAIQQSDPYRQLGTRGRATNRVEHCIQTAQGLARPIQADLAETLMIRHWDHHCMSDRMCGFEDRGKRVLNKTRPTY